MSSLKKLGKMRDLSVQITIDQMKMVETLARDKYKCPQSKSHAIRLMIEDVWGEWNESREPDSKTA